MRHRLRLLAALLPVAALAVAAAPAIVETPTPAEALGLAKGSVFAVLVPAPVAPEASDPGDKPRLPRDYEGEPPRVPHAVDDYLPLSREDNLCIDCHGIAEAEEGDPTAIPASHYTDLRRAPDRVGEALAGARWVCVSCHVAPTAAEPLVDNSFAAAGPAAIADDEPR